MLEFDVRATRDGEIVVLHDPTVDRTTDGTGPVREMMWDEVRQLDAGYRFRDLDGTHSWRGRGAGVPRFEEVLEALPDIRMIVEVKSPDAAPGLVRIVRRHGAEQRVLMATAEEGARASRHGYRGPSSATRRQIRLFMLLQRMALGSFYTPSTDAFQIPDSWKGREVATLRFVEEAHARNMPVHVWTVNEPADMRRLLRLGVDGILSDRPDVLSRVLTEVTGRPPAPADRGSPEESVRP